jgi:RHS repeat-associated protein
MGNVAVHTISTLTNGGCPRYETLAQYYQGTVSAQNLQRTVATDYTYSTYTFLYYGGLINVVPIRETTTWQLPGGATEITQVERDYDAGFSANGYSGLHYGNVVAERLYDYGSGGPGALLRRMVTNFQAFSSSPYLTYNLLDAVSSVAIFDSIGNTCKGVSTSCAYTYNGYDESVLQSSSITKQHNSTPVNGTTRGNVTSTHRWLNGSSTATSNCNVSVSNGYIVSTTVYFDTGEVQHSSDPCGHSTSYQYSSSYYGSLPTTVTNALGQQTNYAYGFNTGVMTSIQDPNLQTTLKAYDGLTRLTSISYPDGGSTTYCYTDAGGPTCSRSGPPYAVVETKAITASPAVNQTSTFVFDGLGRPSQTDLNSDPEGTDHTLTTYDALGRTSQLYNPTRCSPITTNCGEPTWGYRTMNYDALGRPTSVIQADGSRITTDYTTHPCTTVTDEAGKSRKSCVDGLGRIKSVWEDPSGVNYETDYSYDALGNVTGVNQKGSNSATARVRSFVYNSLSQLTSTTNPESGTISYMYDADGDVVTKTAPAPNQTGGATVTTTRNYDALNRITSITYSDGTTPANYYRYDVAPPSGTANLTNLVGRVVTSSNQYGGGTSGKATATYYSYDAMGRVIREWEQTPSDSPNGAWVCATYDLAGNLASINPPGQVIFGGATGCDPTGRIISYAHDAADRLTTMTSSVADAQHPATLFSVDGSVGYFPNGSMRKATFGNGITETHAYNQRFQLCRSNFNSSGAYLSTCGDAIPPGNVLDLHPTFNAGSTDNGNVATWSATGAQTFSRTYAYDALNRIQGMTESASNQACKGMSWTIDAWGNMTNQTGTAGTCYAFTSAVGTNNRLQSGYQYDAAGNLTFDGTHQYTYDAENRIIQVDSGSTAIYIYNENGNRARKTIGSGFTEYYYAPDGTVQIEYDGSSWSHQYIYAASQLVAEYKNGTMQFIHADHLGSTRLVTGVNQSVLDNLDYLPYGLQTSGDTAITHKFASKERDSESGLDMLGARYYASTMGRFMMPDWAAEAEPVPYANLKDPQTLNLYEYVRNNPLSRTDPDGHCDVAAGGGKTEHHWGWCIWHSLGFYQSKPEQIATARWYESEYYKRTNTPASRQPHLTDEQVVNAFHNGVFSAPGNGTKTDILLMLMGMTAYYRGGGTLQARNIDVKIDPGTGLVQPGRGVSVNTEAGSLEKFGGAYKINEGSVPPELEIIQRGGNPNHYEITPREPMTPARYQELLNQVQLEPVSPSK